MLKAQHPDYELFSMGIHANRGVACADCHMPYKRDGGMKYTDHKIQSPLNNISGSCQVCHRESEEKLKQNVYDIQDKVYQIRRIAEQNLVAAHIGAKIALENGATVDEMKAVQVLIRHAQWRWDYMAASNGMGFHAPAESIRILATSIQQTQEARILLTEILMKHNVKLPFSMPDISTKDKAQAFVGLDMKKIREEKDNFRKTVLPEWQKKDPKGY
jgi:nitrite reductase (cytochrome c-552)